MGEEASIRTLIAFLHDELATVASYRRALPGFAEAPDGDELRACLASHERRIATLEQRIRFLGGDPNEEEADDDASGTTAAAWAGRRGRRGGRCHHGARGERGSRPQALPRRRLQAGSRHAQLGGARDPPRAGAHLRFADRPEADQKAVSPRGGRPEANGRPRRPRGNRRRPLLRSRSEFRGRGMLRHARPGRRRPRRRCDLVGGRAAAVAAGSPERAGRAGAADLAEGAGPSARRRRGVPRPALRPALRDRGGAGRRQPQDEDLAHRRRAGGAGPRPGRLRSMPPIPGVEAARYRLLSLGYFLDVHLSVARGIEARVGGAGRRGRGARHAGHQRAVPGHQRGDAVLGRRRRVGDQLPRPRHQPGGRLRRLDQADRARRARRPRLAPARRRSAARRPQRRRPVGDRALQRRQRVLPDVRRRTPTPIPAASSPPGSAAPAAC